MAKPPRLARAIDDPEWVEWAKVKEKKNLEQWPELKPLQDKLLSLGGDWVALEPECDLMAILNRGQLFKGRVIFKKMAPHDCHRNCCKVWAERPRIYNIATGWALSDDGVWRQHTWITKGRAIIETNEPRSLYYGFEMEREEALRFWMGYNGHRK